PPPVDIGSGWTLPLASASQSADLSQWWSALDDPALDRLMVTALAQNLDLRQAAARIDEARALRDRVAGEALPTVGAGVSVNRRRQSENGPLPVGSIPGLDATQTIYDAGFDAAWEADLFGAKRRALEGAGARLQATEAEAQGVRMRIVAEVARTWFTAVGARYELHAQQATLDTLQQTLELVRLRHALGDASAADVEAAYAQWTAVNALIPDIQARQRAAILSLGVLLGAPPERELALLDGPLTPSTLRALPVGERAEMLRRRPDVLAAERRLAASSADIGVATAELFPKLSIGVGGGFQALSTGDWFDASSSRFSILPLISWRLFDGGRVRAEIRAREAAERQAALAYEQAVLTALVDADPANNPASWQWVAGSGADAAPYFRIFNPVTQGEKFDPKGDYVRRFVPELAELGDRFIHRPWDAPASELKQAGIVLGQNYPKPVVALDFGRRRALDAFAALRSE
ncbi:efflux transporter outer membrane subunit, partial [Pseudomonas aeruginosa]|nr:efflux transporter outer membrane subunit [Pseudomonas aeruginosa]